MQEERFRMNDTRNTVVRLEDLYSRPCKELSFIIRGQGSFEEDSYIQSTSL
jgi:hypothetical protein